MINYFLLIVSSLCNGIKSVYAKKIHFYMSEKHNIYTYNFYMFLFAFLLVLIINNYKLTQVYLETIIMAIIFGFFLALAQILLIKAMKFGDVSISSLFYSCGFLVPIFASIFIYRESVSLIQIIGIFLVAVSFVIVVEQGKQERATFKWLLFAFAALLCNGMVGFMQKVFRMSAFSEQQSEFMLISFGVGTILTFLVMPKKAALPSGKFLLTAFVSGNTLALLNIINVYVSGVLPGVIVFPCVNGGGIIASSVLSRFLINENLSKKKKWGILIGLIAICLITM